jgi:hypothetical protein
MMMLNLLLVFVLAATSARNEFATSHGSQEDSRKEPAPVAPDAESLTVKKIFHIAGIPKVSRNARGDLVLTERELVFQQGKKPPLRVSLKQLHRVQLLAGGREYANEAIGAAMVTPFGLGGLLMAVKKKSERISEGISHGAKI